MRLVYLYIKTHNITQLKYFGKTINENIHNYKGSGLYWKRHIKKHNYNVTTELYGIFYEDDPLLEEVALDFSKRNNIVDSNDWANLTEENGLDGGIIKWDENNIKIEALKYKHRSEFKNKCGGAYQTALKLGILKNICSHMIKKFTWTNANIKMSASKYLTRDEFRKHDLMAYQAASKRKIMNEVCSHMPAIIISWCENNIKIEALKYTTRTKFGRGSSGAYAAARKLGILNKVCVHMN